MSNDFKGKVAIVTGGGSGIGRAAAQIFAREGAKVVVSDVDIQSGMKTTSLINDSGGQSKFIKVDVANGVEVKAMVKETIQTYGQLDCAFNNAGVEGTSNILTADYTEEDWNRVIDTNLKGVWLCMKYQIPWLLKQGGGSIVNTSSTAGLIGSRVGMAYGASKFGVIGLTKTAALEYGHQKIRINAVCPGSIDTPMARRIVGDGYEPSIAKTPIPRFSHPSEVAEAVLWLSSEAASFVTGHAMVVDGGYLI